jgi:AraC family transcriptional activator FtrA
VFVLAAAGVLDGRRATTHWRYAERLAQRYPAITVEADALYIGDGQVIASAGSAAGLDMLLHLVRRDYGAKVGNLVAQRLVVAPHREGDQAQFVPRPMAHDEAGQLAKLMAWLRAHPTLPHTVASMATRAELAGFGSEESLRRHFRRVVATSPGAYRTRFIGRGGSPCRAATEPP